MSNKLLCILVEEEDLTQMAVKDSFLLWTHVLVLIGGSVTPVLHLMTDEALSSLGLDMLRTNKSCNPLQLCNQTCCADRDRDEGHTNEACDEPLLRTSLGYLHKAPCGYARWSLGYKP